MTLVLRSTYIKTVRRVRVPVGLVPWNDAGQQVVADGCRYRSIGSLQALALAVAASAVTPALLWLAL
ncbi:protein of unknown function [Methylorubrum extorquens DM4]|uniref:Uncharacterized protein n=1 Tax=Methylorubrum extorquens (strain DSM 6343 / CIP 106787 / DM4) TaxID=661410 RepID=C7C821_METED|nr:hypothetical protein [Methylorubrum extorquens]CAX21950.1 protein of unknown function [Methylorubrum extorquens DM4]